MPNSFSPTDGAAAAFNRGAEMSKIAEIRQMAEKAPTAMWKEVNFSSGKGEGPKKIDGIMNAGVAKFYYEARQDIPNLCDALEVVDELFSIILLKRFDGYAFTSLEAKNEAISKDLTEWCNKTKASDGVTILRANFEGAVEIAKAKIDQIVEKGKNGKEAQ